MFGAGGSIAEVLTGMPADCWAVVPLKTLSLAKQRLATVLLPEEREALVRCMLADVVTVLRRAQGLAGIVLVGDDPALASDDMLWIADPGTGLNGAITAAASRLSSIGVTSMLTVAADLPLVTVAEIESVLAAAATSPVVIAPDRARRGTNGLFLSPPLLLSPQFGNDSLKHHADAAQELGIVPIICDLPGFGFDVDLPEDIDALRQLGGARYAFLKQPGELTKVTGPAACH